jgi:mono/diheme cytochrome c family protein
LTQGTRRGIQAEFNRTYVHGSAWNTLVSADCEKCHEELSQDSSVKIKVWGANAAWPAGSYTTVTYDCTATKYTANSSCLSCHDGDATKITFTGNATLPSNILQYWVNTTTNSHNYAPSTTLNTLPVLVKARSPHGFPTTNKLKQEGWTSAPTYDQTKYTDAAPVSCLECHTSHGSVTASPAKLKGAAFTDTRKDNVMITTAEPTLCWNCHDTATVGVKDYWGDTTTAEQHWTGTLKNTFTYKQRAIASTHQVNDNTQLVVCSICHNPHGASASGQYYSPMLRGSWMTSVYKEDRAGMLSSTLKTTIQYFTKLTQTRFGPRGESGLAYNDPARRGHGWDNGTGTGHDGYFIDENTFGVTGTMTKTWTDNLVVSKHITEADTSFAGLCAVCHTDATYTGTGGITSMKSYLLTTYTGRLTSWGAAIHNTVRGWAGGGGTTMDYVNPTNNPDMRGYSMAGTCTCMSYIAGCSGGWSPWRGYNWQGIPTTLNQMTGANAVHQFPCSKCHTPHASDLPKLMVSNCIDVGADNTQRKAHGTASPAWLYPMVAGTAMGRTNMDVAMLCHNKGKTNTSTGGGWNKVTGTGTW